MTRIAALVAAFLFLAGCNWSARESAGQEQRPGDFSPAQSLIIGGDLAKKTNH